MEPEKKLPRAGTSQATPSTDTLRQSQPATHFYDLSDDILGKVYGMVEDSASKKALRHSCALMYRSPSVNNSLDELILCDDDPDAEDDFMDYLQSFPADTFMDYLQSFPKHADLRTLTFHYAGDLTSYIFHRLLRPDAIGARERLKDVHRLTLRGCDLVDGSTAAYLSFLFPKLREHGGELSVQRCKMHPNFLGILPTLVRLKRLNVDQCDSIDEEECFEMIKYFTSLTKLTVSLSHAKQTFANVNTFGSFSGLQQLNTLELDNMTLLGFDALLCTLPSLHTLSLRSNIVIPPGMRLASGIRVFELKAVGLDFPELRKEDFPALQVVRFGSLYLSRGAEGLSDEEVVSRVSHMAAWISTLAPLCCCSNEHFDLVNLSERSAELSVSVLDALSPLQQCFMSAREFVLAYFNMTKLAFISALCKLCQAQQLVILGCVYDGEVLKHGLVEMVQAMPRLKFLSMSFSHCTVPRDLLAALTVCQRAGRRLTMDFSGSSASSRSRLQGMHEEWYALKALFPGPLTADFLI